MMQLASRVRVFVCAQPADMRRSFDGLSGMVTQIVKQDPLSGHLFVFRNRNRDRLKILYWDRDGLAIWYKRLEQGTYQLPTDVKRANNAQGEGESESTSAEITAEDLSLLLGGIDLRTVERRKRFQRPSQPR